MNLDKVLVGGGGGSGELSNFQIERSLQAFISRLTSDFELLISRDQSFFSSYVSEDVCMYLDIFRKLNRAHLVVKN